ncbi:hypothetical protein D3C81_1890010 [compost metagenome]
MFQNIHFLAVGDIFWVSDWVALHPRFDQTPVGILIDRGDRGLGRNHLLGLVIVGG